VNVARAAAALESFASMSETGADQAVRDEGRDGAGAERRRKRSDDPVTALHYQLALTRSAAALDALVLVDDAGCLIAGAGAWPTCEELAAYAPLLARPAAIKSGAVGTRIAALSSEVSVRALSLGGFEALLCGRGGVATSDAHLARAAAGCQRILGD
jgi:hypothetical protein